MLKIIKIIKFLIKDLGSKIKDMDLEYNILIMEMFIQVILNLTNLINLDIYIITTKLIEIVYYMMKFNN